MDLTAIPVRNSNDWRRIPARARNDWHVGMDIGQSVDPSAICALNHIVEPLYEWTPHLKGRYWKQEAREQFLVRHLERLPLGMSYPAQIQHVANLLSRDPLKDATFSLDFTGVGRPVGDSFVRAGLRPRMILITAGNEVGRGDGGAIHVPKTTLVSGLESRLHAGELKIAAELVDAPALKDELKDFSRKVSAAGRVQFAARGSAHDDLVLAVCLALFTALNRHESSVEPLRF